MQGTSFPHYYHLTESILVFTVLILSYNGFLFPKLNSYNYLSFFNENQLFTIIKTVLNMSPDKYWILKKNAEELYDKELSIDFFF